MPMQPHPKPVMLVILDGFGWREERADNAVTLARKPNFDRLWAESPHAFLKTCGLDVGLPEGQMGNSEVGHTNIGGGRVVMQELPRIDQAISSGELAQNPALKRFTAALRDSGGACHLLGLISPGGVHSHQDHVVALARLVVEAGIAVRVHAITDGRDTPPEAGADYVRSLMAGLPQGAGIATVIGRYFAMDRDRRWDRVRLAYDLFTSGKGSAAEDPVAAIRQSHQAGITDEFIKPVAIGGYQGMADGDGLLCANFRADRVRQILDALLDADFDGFPRTKRVKFAAALGMRSYSNALDRHLHSLFPPEPLDQLLGGIVSAAKLRQLRIAETEKYPHVTYFLNGGREEPFEGEERILIPSPKVATYDLQPEMSAPEVTARAVGAIRSGSYDLIVLNFANPDMVGHTGSLDAAVKAVEAVDEELGRIAEAVKAQGGALLVAADHGNCEMMRDPETGGPHTAHTLNRVPVLLAFAPPGTRLHDGRLADLAPTLLALMGLEQPRAMTGASLTDAPSPGR
ncbi:MAG TPA: 2,3-bisphosphoglycerate-independent phosphoglycerate mutase [Acetobacteraceae bacterium]|nr:2,3-bisphosphoglycerate-independent phosphoglycerate mutase [Acetobacteraceae bacterium]